jgi:signal transduction histidine kinase/DNA-binding NarL/FixJ family response regulator
MHQLKAAGVSGGGACPYLVLLDEQNQPTGVVPLHRLLLHLMVERNASPVCTDPLPGLETNWTGQQIQDFTLDLPLQRLTTHLVEPVTVLSDNLSLVQLLPLLALSEPKQYVIVDSGGRCLGRLDSFRLLQFLLTHPLLLIGGGQDTQLNGSEKPLFAREIGALIDLISRLPLPLMLQTSSGRTLVQNSLWQQQLDELQEPAQIQQDAALVLENSSATSHLCHLGGTPNTCVCTCTLKDGREQVLQLLKIPLGALPSQESDAPLAATVHPSGSTQHPTPEQGGLPFRLAGLRSDSSFYSLWETSPDIFTPHLGRRSPPAPLPSSRNAPSERLWLILAQDITEQHRLARELTAKNADLVQLNRLKDEFLACISHELRTPLTAVLGLSSLLKDQTLGEMSQRQVHYAQLIYQSGRQLMAVVNDILDLTRMETGQLELMTEPVGVLAVCNRAVEQATQGSDSQGDAAEQAFPSISLEVEPGIDFLVADEQRLRQMLVHLLSNALKFTESNGRVGLRVNHWEGWIAFTVWDTGIGIAAEKQHLIFQKFQQLENPLTRRFEGTGLGLVLTQRLARLHGGDVTFISKEGQGSQFTILLPPSPPNRTPSAQLENSFDFYGNGSSSSLPPSESPPAPVQEEWRVTHARRDRLVLVVEVVPTFIETLSEQLNGLGYRVVVARSGPEALEKARRLQPCIIFLNPVLPLLSGWDVLTLLKATPETRQIPVAVTATKAEERRSQGAQVDGWLSLPLEPKALRQMVQRLTETELIANPPGCDRITVLQLKPPTWDGGNPSSEMALFQSTHFNHYRLLEADDLDQAELLARVWKPDVVLLYGIPPGPEEFLHQYNRCPALAALPLVTLNQEITRLANQIPGLLVFPCLAPSSGNDSEILEPEPSTLLQVIQIAAGYDSQAAVLMVDIANLPITPESPQQMPDSEPDLGGQPQQMEWLQAAIQYLRTAGLRGNRGHSWQYVMQQIQSQGVDLLLICLTKTLLEPDAIKMLTALQQLEVKPPILALDLRGQDRSEPDSFDPVLSSLLHCLPSQVLPPDLSMADLLVHIQQALDHRNQHFG